MVDSGLEFVHFPTRADVLNVGLIPISNCAGIPTFKTSALAGKPNDFIFMRKPSNGLHTLNESLLIFVTH